MIQAPPMGWTEDEDSYYRLNSANYLMIWAGKPECTYQKSEGIDCTDHKEILRALKEWTTPKSNESSLKNIAEFITELKKFVQLCNYTFDADWQETQ